ncbi:virulence factor SrfB, partial [Enterobacter sp. IF2SW-B1]|uniref:virulence factor SrfB n=1 Tax=Enterobacter sp. IF2SW-B1 TaxID=1841143 RepID=UPI0015860B54
RLPDISPQYSRSTLMTHKLCELLAQALGQINSVATRQRLGFPAAPRPQRPRLQTRPAALPQQAREIFRRRMFEALAIVWKAMGWHPQDEDFATRKPQEKSVVPVPEIQMEWDEASCGQLV